MFILVYNIILFQRPLPPPCPLGRISALNPDTLNRQRGVCSILNKTFFTPLIKPLWLSLHLNPENGRAGLV